MGRIERFKTFEEAESTLWCLEFDPNYYRRVAALWKFADDLRPSTCPRGVFRYSTLEEANKAAEEWIVSSASCKS
jgi:hypothetical protein